jgi:DNA polymerase-3 subunit delta'
LHAHVALRARLQQSLRRGTLPASLLLHGPRGVGKQQLGLWLARALLCEQPDAAPCGACASCRLAAQLKHPDLHWFFPRPRLKDSDPSPADVREDMAEGVAARLESGGLYEPAAGDEGIFVATVRALVQTAAISPAMGARKLFVVGDADRMVAQEGADYAANAFLKLLEEPPANTTIILTSSEPGALLPTIRSRVVAVRVAPLSDEDVRAFLADPAVADNLDVGAAGVDEVVRLAGGAPGRLVGREAWQNSLAQAHRLVEAAASPDRGSRFRVALAQGGSGARGKYSDTLDALTVVLHDRVRGAVDRGRTGEADGAARAVAIVEEAKEQAAGNVSPQLVTASLLTRLAPLVK